jgi:cytochrome c-type biogenesis protein CcmH
VKSWSIVAALLVSALPALGVEPSERLADPALEARARAVSRELRCLVCQNESIDESNADLAHDLRLLLRQRIQAGDSDAQATDFIVKRYGDFVLLKPPVEPATYLLWGTPIVLVIFGGAGALIHARRRGVAGNDAPLSADEKKRLDALMREQG